MKEITIAATVENIEAVTDFVNDYRRNQIHRQLKQEVEGHQKGNLRQRNPVGILKGQKQQQCKIIDNCLHDIAYEAGIDGPFIIYLHGISSFLFTY